MTTDTSNLSLDHLAVTHDVFNQSAPLEGYNNYLGDTALRELVAHYNAGWAEEDLIHHGERCGSAQVFEWGFLANEYKPRFMSHDRQGHRVDLTRYHDAYHQLMKLGLEAGLHSAPWTNPGPGAHVARAAKYYLQAQIEAGHGCPLTMTFASVPSLRLTPAVGDQWLPKVLNRS